MPDGDRPVDVGVQTSTGIITVPCASVDDDCIDGFLAVHDPLGYEPNGVTGLHISADGDTLLLSSDLVVSIDGTRDSLGHLLGDSDD